MKTRIRFDTPDLSDMWSQSQQARFEAEALRQLGPSGNNPDWVFAYFISSAYGLTKNGYHVEHEGMQYDAPQYPQERNFKVCGRVSDMHHFQDKFWNWLNDLDVDLLFFAYPEYSHTNKAVWLPWSVDPNYYYPREKKHDVAVLGACGKSYPLRASINGNIVKLCKENKWRLLKPPSASYGTSPHTPIGSAEKMSIRAYDDGGSVLVGGRYAEAMGASDVVLTGTSIYKYPIKRVFEALSSGCVLMSNDPNGADSLGLKDGENYLRITRGNWMQRLEWVLTHQEEMRKIQENGRKLVLERHTHNIRVKQMVEAMSKI